MTQTKIPILDLTSQIETLWDDLNAAIQDVLRSGQFIMGPYVQAFEQEVADYLGTKHAIGVNSGTDALVIALRAAGVGPGDEVITSPFSFFATAESISNLGAEPVFVDIDGQSYNIDPAAVEAAITDDTRAIVPVHLYGNAAEMEMLLDIAQANNLKIVEDCAQSFGATYKGKQTGTIGDAGAYSFFPSKNLGAYGDGGLIATNDDELAAAARMLRVHGAAKKYHNEVLGYNSRLDAMQAAILSVKLPHIDAWNDGRRAAARYYNEKLADAPGIVTPDAHDGHVFHQYTVRLTNGNRDDVKATMADTGINTMIYYPIPQDQLPVYGGSRGTCPVSDTATDEVLSLPIWPEITREVQDQVVQALLDTLG